MVPKQPDSPFLLCKNLREGEKAKIKLKAKKYNPATQTRSFRWKTPT